MPRKTPFRTMASSRSVARAGALRLWCALLLAVGLLSFSMATVSFAQGTSALRRLPPIERASGAENNRRWQGHDSLPPATPAASYLVNRASSELGAFPAPGSSQRTTTQLAEFQEALPIPETGPEQPAEESLDLWEDNSVVPIEIPVTPLQGNCGNCGSCGSCVSCGCYSEQCASRTRIGRFFCGVYHGICCPDPCYDPHWKGLADSAFFTAAARPVTQSRFRWDAGLNMILPDRAEYFWARSDGDGRGRPSIETGLTYHDLTHYTEVAHGRFSAFTEFSYRSLDPEVNTHSAGFGDLTAGTKSLLFDCELLQITMQTKFITPTGNASKGFGTGHLSIEPSLIAGINLGPQSYLQAQVAEWIPIGGDPAYEGAILHYHVAYNRTLLGRPQAIHVIGSAELNGYSFQDGAYSDPILNDTVSASGETYLSGALGLRMIICEKIDFGLSYANTLTENHWAEQLFRSEMRVRF